MYTTTNTKHLPFLDVISTFMEMSDSDQKIVERVKDLFPIIFYEKIVHLFSKKSPENPGGFSEKSPVPRGFECSIPRPHAPSRGGAPGG